MPRGRPHSQRGFTLIELVIVVAIIVVLAAIAIALYANVQARAQLAKAQADARTLGTAVSIYGAPMGTLPSVLPQLTSVTTNAQGQRVGPFVAAIASGPLGLATDTFTPVLSREPSSPALAMARPCGCRR